MSALDPRTQTAHDRAVAANRPGYTDPFSGLFVMTDRYLLARGRCCGSRCRHCPWHLSATRTPTPASR